MLSCPEIVSLPGKVELGSPDLPCAVGTFKKCYLQAESSKEMLGKPARVDASDATDATNGSKTTVASTKVKPKWTILDFTENAPLFAPTNLGTSQHALLLLSLRDNGSLHCR